MFHLTFPISSRIAHVFIVVSLHEKHDFNCILQKIVAPKLPSALELHFVELTALASGRFSVSRVVLASIYSGTRSLNWRRKRSTVLLPIKSLSFAWFFRLSLPLSLSLFLLKIFEGERKVRSIQGINWHLFLTICYFEDKWKV